MRPLTHDEYLAMRRFPALDGLRAVAAVMVVFFHYGGWRWAWLNGWIGVHMFFVLSGFLITTLALREEDRRGRLSLRDFYLRRAFRILPVYYVLLGATVAMYWLRGEYQASGLPMLLDNYLTFTNEWVGPGKVFGQSWTLGIEQKFYVLWPLLAFGVGALSFGRRFGLAVATTVALVLLIPVFRDGAGYLMILIGCLAAIALHNRRAFAVLRPLTHPISGLFFAVAAFLIQINIGPLDQFFGHGLPGPTMYAAAIALMIVGVLSRGPLQWVLSTAVMRFAGERSYSLYLVQGLAGLAVLATFPPLHLHPTAAAVLITLFALMVSDQLYRWVELPMIDRGRQLIEYLRRRRAAREAATAAPVDPEPAVDPVAPGPLPVHAQ